MLTSLSPVVTGIPAIADVSVVIDVHAVVGIPAVADVPFAVGIPAVAGTLSFTVFLCIMLEEERRRSAGVGTKGDGSARGGMIHCKKS